MSNQIVLPADLITNENTDLETFKSVTKAGDWLARLQLFGSNSDAVKKRLIPMAHYGKVGRKDDITDLGEEVSVIPINWRPLALSFGEEIISVYDRTDPLFAEIQAKADEKDSDCVFGPQFLLWLPTEREFLLYHMNSKTARGEAPKLLKLLGQHTVFKAKYIETKNYSWHGPQILPNPVAPVSLPEPTRLTAEVNKFRNPPKQEVEKAEEADSTAEERAR